MGVVAVLPRRDGLNVKGRVLNVLFSLWLAEGYSVHGFLVLRCLSQWLGSGDPLFNKADLVVDGALGFNI